MSTVKHYFTGTRTGKSEKGDFYVINLMTEEADGRSFQNDYYVDVEMYVKASGLNRFQEVDAIFLPSFNGKARLVSIEGL